MNQTRQRSNKPTSSSCEFPSKEQYKINENNKGQNQISGFKKIPKTVKQVKKRKGQL